MHKWTRSPRAWMRILSLIPTVVDDWITQVIEATKSCSSTTTVMRDGRHPRARELAVKKTVTSFVDVLRWAGAVVTALASASRTRATLTSHAVRRTAA